MRKALVHFFDNQYVGLWLSAICGFLWMFFRTRRYAKELEVSTEYINELEKQNFQLRAILEEHRGVQKEYRAALQAQKDYNDTLKDIIKYLNNGKDFPCPPDPLQEPEMKQ